MNAKNYMNNMEIKKGDVVRLKSGGPAMTVEEYPVILVPKGEDNTHAKCVWFNDKELKQASFPIDSLVVE